MCRNSIDNVNRIRKSLEFRNGNGLHTTDELISWIDKLNEDTYVSVEKTDISESGFWLYDDIKGEMLNIKRSFFSVIGMKYYVNGVHVLEQPVIDQPEIGFLGIIAKEINGVLHFLMQAKIEPGNVNCVQISPTIQATKSNFTRAHGGRLPEYFEIFENCRNYRILYDQIQSEQGSRFYGKRNRNIIIEIDEDIEETGNFRWMTLGQIKEFMLVDNLVNMDSRTVLSGLDYFETGICECGYEQLMCGINDYKMFNLIKQVRVPLNELDGWKIESDGRMYCQKGYNFNVDFFSISIDGREVHSWEQPLLVSEGMGLFALMYREGKDGREYLVRLVSEIGILDSVEVGPSVQLEHKQIEEGKLNVIEQFVFDKINRNEGLDVDVILSEEGGRFYHEQNRNIICRIEVDELTDIPEGYYWVGFGTLQRLVKANNFLNIQLRNLMSVLQEY